jgi:hypothetical protein
LKCFVEVYPIEGNPYEVYPIEAYLIGKGVVEVASAKCMVEGAIALPSGSSAWSTSQRLVGGASFGGERGGASQIPAKVAFACQVKPVPGAGASAWRG